MSTEQTTAPSPSNEATPYFQLRERHIEELNDFIRKPGEIQLVADIEAREAPFRRKLVLWMIRTTVQSRFDKRTRAEIKVPVREQKRLLVVSDHTIKSEDDPRWEEMATQFFAVVEILTKYANRTLEHNAPIRTAVSRDELSEHFAKYGIGDPAQGA